MLEVAGSLRLRPRDQLRQAVRRPGRGHAGTTWPSPGCRSPRTPTTPTATRCRRCSCCTACPTRPTGGESGLVDGFHAAVAAARGGSRRVRPADPHPGHLPATRDAATELTAHRPMIGLDPLRPDPRDPVQQPVAATGAAARTSGRHGVLRRLPRASPRSAAGPRLQVNFRLGPGDCVIFDNTRILHARTAFADAPADRHLQGCYADLDGFASNLAVLRRRSARDRQGLRALFDGPRRRRLPGRGGHAGGSTCFRPRHLAEAAGAPPSLVAAALLHDVGHFTGAVSGPRSDGRHRQPAQPRRRRLAGAVVRPGR